MGLRTMKRRRREHRTDYKARRILLESGIPRIVVRRTNKYFILQAVESSEAQDKVVATVTSKELLKNGWDAGGDSSNSVSLDGSQSKIAEGSSTKSMDGSATPETGSTGMGSLKSIPAGYLTGILMAKKLKKGKFIVDLGMARTLKGSRVFAVVKGLIDGGLDISANEKVFPSEDRLNGEHMKAEVKDMIAKVKGGLK